MTRLEGAIVIAVVVAIVVIITTRIDLGNNGFSVHDVDESGKPGLVRPTFKHAARPAGRTGGTHLIRYLFDSFLRMSYLG